MNKRIFIFSVIFVITFAREGLGQEQKKIILSQTRKIQQYFESRNPIKEAFRKINKMKKEFQATNLGVDDMETATIVRSLKDPFMPQLPTPTKPKIQTNPIEKPTPKPTPAPKRPPERVEPKPIEKREPVSPPQLNMSGLVWNTDRPQAILNGQIVNEGDTIDHWTIVDISKKGVEVTSQNATFMIEPSNRSGL